MKNNNLSRDLNSVWEIGRLLGHAAQIWRNTSFGAVAEKLLLFKVQLFCSLFLSIGHALTSIILVVDEIVDIACKLDTTNFDRNCAKVPTEEWIT